MLDQLSGGRLEIGFGRGSVPIELEYYGADPDDAQEVYAEAVEVVLKGLTQQGARFRGQAILLPQRADGDRAAAEAASADLVRRAHAGQRRARGAPQSQRRQSRSAEGNASVDRSLSRDLAAGPRPRGALSPSSASAASSWSRRPTPRPWRWRAAPTCSGTRALPICSAGTAASQSHPRPATFDLVVERGQGVAGSPATVAKLLSAQLDETGCNYMVGQFAFGDLTLR